MEQEFQQASFWPELVLVHLTMRRVVVKSQETNLSSEALTMKQAIEWDVHFDELLQK